METLVWQFLFYLLFYLFEKNSCQVPSDHNTKPLNSIILLPASSEISYEALHYPIPVEQYQVVPLVFNTGKIPLINHAIQAPIQYLIPNNENQQIQNYYSEQYLTPRQKYRSTTQHSPITNTNKQIENQQAYKNYPPTTIYSEKHVEGQPSLRYSYGYKIIDGDIGNSNNQHEIRDNGNISESYSLTELGGTKKDFEYMNNMGTNFQTVANKQKLENTNKKDELNLSKALNPIVVKPDVNTIKTELKKHYKNTTYLETTTNGTDQIGSTTMLKP